MIISKFGKNYTVKGVHITCVIYESKNTKEKNFGKFSPAIQIPTEHHIIKYVYFNNDYRFGLTKMYSSNMIMINVTTCLVQS